MTKKLMMMLAAAAAAFGAWGDTETVGGYTWTYRINGDTAEIYNDGGVAVSPAPTDVLSIPSTLGGKTMTSIGNDAFRGCISLTGVTIPDTVTKIGSGAFYGCEQLTLLKIPDSVKTIGNYAFYNCVALSSLHIGSGLEQINFFTFGHCRSLMSLDIPDKVTAIADSAFYGCTGLTSVTIPTGVTSINGGAFEACDNLCTFVVAEGNTSFSVKDGLLYNKEGTCLIRCPYGLTEVVVPNGVTSIGYRAFSVNNSLVKVTLPEGVAQIDDCAFIYCRGLKDLTIPNGVTNIGDSVFQFCGKLTNISFPASLSTIGEGEFYGCSSLTNIIFGGNAPTIGNNCFTGIGSSCTVRVSRDSSGWGVDIPGTWKGMRIEYMPEAVMVKNVVAKQRYPWNGLVDITCKVTGIDGETNGLKLAVAAVIPNSGNVRNVSHFWVVQDGANSVDREVHTNGNYRLLWDARADLGIVRYTNMVVRVNFDAHEKVQLWEGGPYWATTNIGAENPEDYGYYFWWGDTVGYKREGDVWVASDGSSSNFSFGSKNTPTYTKGISALQSQGWIEADNVLALKHDAAQVQWGGGWRMPTYQEVAEISSNCDWSWTTINGVVGYVVRGRGDYASALIFLPCPGYGTGTSIEGVGSLGGCWASTPESGVAHSYGFHLTDDGYGVSSGSRFTGLTIRPVQGSFLDSSYATAEDAGVSTPFLLDTKEGMRIAQAVELISYSTAWNGASSVRVAAGGTKLKEATAPASGDVVWNAAQSGVGRHMLTHTAGGETLTAQFTVLDEDVVIHGGMITVNEVWESNKVHLVTAPITLGDNDFDYYYELEIQPGAIVKFMPGTGFSIESNAYCRASGAIFTHVNDDTVGGDTLMDGDETAPVMDDYSLPNMLLWDETIELRYYSDPNVTLSGTISEDETWRGHNIYCVTGNLTVASGATLTLQPGTVIKFNTGCSLTVNGTLDAQGTRAAPIVFTSLKDDEHGGDTNGDGDKTYPWAGDWGCVLISGGNIKASYCRFTYGSGVDGNQYGARACLFMWNGGSGTFDGCWFGGSTMDGCFAQNAIFRNCIFTDCDRGLVSHTGTITAINCVAAYNRIGFFSHTSPLVVRNSISSLNFESAITGDGGSRQTYNCYFGNDPKFLDPENGDFRIAENSPCINAGDAANAPEFDYYGQPRNGAPDIGIYEVLGDTGTGYDLAAAAVNALAARSTIGDTIEVSYDVANVGRLTVTDPWHDALYLVSSTSGRQYALGEPLNPGGIGAGETRTFTSQFALPVVPVGQYRLRLVVNSRRMDVPEGAATENNAIVSEGEIEVVADSIDAADGASGSVAAGASSVCAFTLPSGSGDRLMRVTSSAGGATLSARCGLGFLPVNADAGTALSFSGGAAWISVPAGTEKVWLVLDNGGTAAAPYEVEFIEGSLTLSGITPASIPSSGNVTVEIAGAGFTDACEVSFTGAGTVAPLSVKRVSQGLLVATVDAAAFASGKTYSVAVKKGTETKTLQDALSVATAPGKPKFWAKLDVPSSMRQGRLVETCFIEYGNSGTADMLSPVLQVSLTGDGTLGYIGGLSGLKTLQFIAAGDAGSAGVLRPGSSHRIRFAVRAGASNKISLHTSEGSDYAPAPWTNAADYLADLSAAATRIEKLGKDSSDFAMVNECADYIRRDELPNAVIGRLTDEFGQFAIGYLIEVENQISTNVYSVVTSSSGVFCFEGLPKGRYRVRSTNVPLCESNREFEIVDSSDIVDLGTIMMSFAGEIRIHTSSFSSGESVHLESLVDGYVYRPCNADLCFNGFPSGYYAAEWSCNDGVHVRQIFYYEAGEVKEITLLRTKGNSVTVCCQEALQSEGCVAMLCNVNGLKILPFDGKEEVSFDDVENGQYVVVVRNESSDIFLVDMISLESDVAENLRVELSSDLESVTLMQSSARMNKSGQTTSVRNLSTSQYELSWWEKILYWSDDEFEDNLVAFMTHFDDIVAMKPNPPTGEYNCIHNYALYENRISRYNAIRDEFYLTFMQKFYAYRAKQAFKGAKTAEWPIEVSKTLAGKYLPFGWGTAAANLIEYGKRYCAGEIAFESYAEEFDKWAVDLMSSHYDEILEMSKGVGPRARTARKLLEEWGKTGKALHYAGLATEILNYMILSLETGEAVAAYEIAKKQLDSAWQKMEIHINDFLQYENRWAGYGKCCSEEPQKKYDPPTDNKTPNVPKSCDPNEMVGEYGVGDARYVKPGQELTYTIYFENKSGFDIADAQEVKVTNPLSEWLDWSTFEMREVAFNNQCDVTLDRVANGTSEVQMNGTNKYVRTTVELVATDGTSVVPVNGQDARYPSGAVASWYLRVYDPNGDSEGYPTDGSGFLPSNDDTHRGEGHITYRIKVREDAPRNVVITNSATIVFDGNDPIETDPAWWNTVAPISSSITLKPNSTTRGSVSGGGTYKIGATATLKATAKSGYAFAGWFTDKACTKPLNPRGYDNRSPTVKIVVPENDTTIYAKFVTAAEAKKSLKFSSATMKLAKTPAKATAGGKFSLKLGISSASLVTVTATGLPKGLKIDKATGAITGTATVVGDFTATVTVKDAAGNKITQKVKITARTASYAKGTFYGTAKPDGKTLSYLKFTVGSTGKVSGKVTYKGKAYSFTSAYKSCTAVKATFAPKVKIGKKTFKPGTVTVKTRKAEGLSLVEAANSKGTFAAQKMPGLVKKGKALAALVGKTFTFTKVDAGSGLTKDKDKLTVKLASGDAVTVSGTVGGKKLTAISWVTLVSDVTAESGAKGYTLYVDIIDAKLKYERTLVVTATVGSGGVKATAAFAK